MSRKYIDCRDYPSDINCSIALSADSDDELLEAAVQHAVAVHGFQDNAELRQELKSMFKEGTPPIAAPSRAQAAV
jgi:predicted small metal-binding protein